MLLGVLVEHCYISIV